MVLNKRLVRAAALAAALTLLFSVGMGLRQIPLARATGDTGLITITDVSLLEGNVGTTPFVFTVTWHCFDALNSALTLTPMQGVHQLDWHTEDVTAKAGEDYTAGQGTLSFDFGTPAPETDCHLQSRSQTITVLVNGDTTVERLETFHVVLSQTGGSSPIAHFPSPAVGTINDDDGPTMSIGDASVQEGDAGTAKLTFWVTLAAPVPDAPIAVDYLLLPGTASGGQDYALLTGASDHGQPNAATLKFPAGETREPITVAVYGDKVHEADETVSVRLFNSDLKLDRDTGIGTIVNDDALPTLSVSDGWVTEGTGTSVSSMVFTVSVPAPYSGLPVSVDYSTADGTSTAGQDYPATSGTVTLDSFVPSTTISVPVTPDSVAEPNETLSLTLANPTNATLTRTQASGTIIDDDGRAFAFSDLSGTPVSGTPQSLTLTAKVSHASDAPTDTAFVGTPVLSAPGDTHFAPGSCSAAAAGVSTCTGVIFGALGAQHLVATNADSSAEPTGTTSVMVQATAIRIEPASPTVQAGYPWLFVVRPVAGVDGASIDGYQATRHLTVVGGSSSPASGSSLSCSEAVCYAEATFPDTGLRTVQVSDDSSPARASAAVPVEVTEALAPPPGLPEGEQAFPLVAKVDLFDGAGARVPEGVVPGDWTGYSLPAANRIAERMAVDPGLRQLLVTGRWIRGGNTTPVSAAPQISVVNMDSLQQVARIPLSFGPTYLGVDPVRHVAFASGLLSATDALSTHVTSTGGLATIALASAVPPKIVTLPAEPPPSSALLSNQEQNGAPAFAVSSRRGVLYALTHESGSVHVHALDTARLAAGAAFADADLWSGGYALPPAFCHQTWGDLALDATESFLYFDCPAGTAFDLPGTLSHVVARLDLATSASALPTNARFLRLPAPQGADTLSSPADGRLTKYVGGAGVIFDPAHDAYLGTTQLVPGGWTLKALGAGSAGRRYAIGDRTGDQANNTDRGVTDIVIRPSSVTVSQAGRLPADAGVTYPLLDGAFSFLNGGPRDAAFDPVTRRLFFAGSGYTRPTDRYQTNNGSTTRLQIGVTEPSHAVFVFQDRLPDVRPAALPNPDEATHDVEEVPGRTPVSYAAGASAYGAIRRSIGAYPGTYCGLCDPTVDHGNRAVTSAQVSATGLSDSAASATAVGTALDAGTEKDIADNGGPPPDSMSTQFVPSHCSDFSDKPSAVTDNQGSTVACDLGQHTVHATATEDAQSAGPPPGADSLMGVGSVASSTSLVRDPVKGTISRAEAIARDITIAGVIHIGEVHSVAQSAAHGRPGTAVSTWSSSVSHFVLTDPAGVPLFSCDVCTPAAVADAINAQVGLDIYARAGQPDPDPLVRGSVGGAQAGVLKAPYNYWNDFNSFVDPTHEVYGLEIFLDRSGTDATTQKKGLLLELAGVATDAHYAIGLPLPVPVVQPGSLKIALLDAPPDAVPPGAPLAGGAFEVHTDSNADGVLGLADPLIPGGACLTAADGTGTCSIAELAPGAYLIHETAPPAGYAGAPDLAVTITSAFRTLVTYVNPKAVGRIEITLGDTAHPPNPLAGGVFEVFADNGDGTLGPTDTSVGTCTTDAAGACPAFVDVPLGAYVVHEKSPPAGYLGAPDAAFALTLPGQLAKSDFVNPKGVGVVAVSLVDAGTPPKPLAGGVFDLYADDGDGTLGAADVLRTSCTTTVSGACPLIADVPLGHYLVHEKTAPAGYAAAGDTAFSLKKADETAQVAFVNPKAIGRIEVSLTGATKPSKPLAGGVFQLLADANADGKLDPADLGVGTCTTDTAGACPAFVDVPLGAYLVHQQTAPQGYLASGDAHFAVSKPGETTRVAFVDGTPGTPPVPPTVIPPAKGGPSGTPGTKGKPGTPAHFIPGKSGKKPVYVTKVVVFPGTTGAKPITHREPLVAPTPGLGQQFIALPGSAWRLLTRTPMQALLFALVWLLLGLPGYLGARRHRLSRIREGI